MSSLFCVTVTFHKLSRYLGKEFKFYIQLKDIISIHALKCNRVVKFKPLFSYILACIFCDLIFLFICLSVFLCLYGMENTSSDLCCEVACKFCH